MSSSPGSRPQTGASTNSSNNGASNTMKKKTMKKKMLVPVNLEEVFNQISTVTSSNLNPPPGKVVLSPRSAEDPIKNSLAPTGPLVGAQYDGAEQIRDELRVR
jgi:hypothetical protein